MSILDEISAEVAQLSDEEIAKAAEAIQARKAKEKAKMTPEKKEAMKERERRKRAFNKAVLEAAKAKGLVKDGQVVEAAEATA